MQAEEFTHTESTTVVPSLMEIAHSWSFVQEISISSSQTIMGGVCGCPTTRLGDLLFKGPSGVGDVVGTHPIFPHIRNDGDFPVFEVLPIPTSTHVLIQSDNLIAVNRLNRQGSAKSSPLSNWTLSILHLLKKRGLFLIARHIAGIQNAVACPASIHCHQRRR